MNKDNELYLPLKQVYFDQIVAGTKKEEYREVKLGVTMNRYLRKADNSSGYELNPECTDPSKTYYWDDYNDGKYPFMPKDIKYLNLAVGYAKDRDTCTVEVESITFEPGRLLGNPPQFAWWIMVFHLGKVSNVYRKKR